MIKFQVDGEWFLYEHDTRSWAFYEPEFNLIGNWFTVLPEDDEEDIGLPDDYAQWVPDN